MMELFVANIKKKHLFKPVIDKSLLAISSIILILIIGFLVVVSMNGCASREANAVEDKAITDLPSQFTSYDFHDRSNFAWTVIERCGNSTGNYSIAVIPKLDENGKQIQVPQS